MSVPRLAISNEFMDALARLPKSQRKKVQEFAKKFRADPKSAAINYEKIHNMADDRVRTVRIDQKYRAVVLHPDSGNTYVLVWVDNHDEAMDWARNRTFEVHPETQSLQILNVEQVQQAVAQAATASANENALFSHDDATFLSFGIPPVLLPAVRQLQSKEQLTQLQNVLPAEAFESLVWLAEGESIESVKEYVGLLLEEKEQKSSLDEIAEEDRALASNQSSRRFRRVDSDDELDRVLSAPLEQWRVFLHPHQRQMTQQSFAGPTLVLGGAGTGKTIVAMHRARQLALKLSPDERVLFTTFTKNLAENVRSVLRTFCGDEYERIEVQHIHEHAMSWLRTSGPVQVASDDDISLAWDQVAIDNPTKLETDVLRDEWFYTHAIRGVTTRDEYLQMSRVGRTPSLSRREKAGVWKAFENFDEALRLSGKLSWVGVTTTASNLSATAASPTYRHVIVDEGQDFTASDWRFIRSLVRPAADDLFIVADPRQRIYHEPTQLADGDIHISERIHRLQINYRTTEQIRSWATGRSSALTTADLCDSSWSEISTHSLFSGPEPVLLEHDDQQSESNAIAELVLSLKDEFPPEEIAIVVRAGWLLKKLKSGLKKEGVEFTVLDGDTSVGSGVQLATMHRVKGLEFRCVIIAGLADAVFPTKFRGRDEDQRARDRHIAAEQNLLYVAATRARDQLYVSTVGGFANSQFLTGGESC
ncbi:ATP-dependent DNA helicase UvrD2 [Rubripirellula obstinata]|uniref:DNA 3'-5' helicase n=1 Tax=Rubripirellula obstinata TaxID=406547 RepID=A0A5B1CG13_9BACT|nr:3'-5' exonuclease [Rubripirellula obstinata]KAA1258194.1 ATP-dependent DNA helicase UvrD2 [Rubripirellula obstinata]